MSTQNAITMTESEWLDKYMPLKVPEGIPSGGWSFDNEDDSGDLLFETYGDAITELKKYDNKFVWTLIEEDGEQFVIEGYHLVNRLGYFITKIPHNNVPHLIRVVC